MTHSTVSNDPDDDAVVATDLRKHYGKKLALDGLTPATSGSLSVFGGLPGSDASRQRTGAVCDYWRRWRMFATDDSKSLRNGFMSRPPRRV